MPISNLTLITTINSLICHILITIHSNSYNKVNINHSITLNVQNVYLLHRYISNTCPLSRGKRFDRAAYSYRLFEFLLWCTVAMSAMSQGFWKKQLLLQYPARRNHRMLGRENVPVNQLSPCDLSNLWTFRPGRCEQHSRNMVVHHPA